MTDIEKKNYNRDHYLRNKEVLLSKARARYQAKSQKSESIIPLFEPKKKQLAPKLKNERFTLKSFPISLIPLLLLVGVISGFLFSESAKFYSEFDSGAGSAYLKAFILEGAAIVFSLLKGHSTLYRVLYRTMIILIYSYSIWVVSGGVIQKTLNQYSQVQQSKRLVSELENDLSTKLSVRDSYFSAKRITAGMQVDKGLQTVRQKLDRARETLVHLPNSSVIWNTLFTLVIFRILAMFSNLLILREVSRKLSPTANSI